MTAQEFIEQIGPCTHCDLQFRVKIPGTDLYDICQFQAIELVKVNGTATIQINLTKENE